MSFQMKVDLSQIFCYLFNRNLNLIPGSCCLHFYIHPYNFDLEMNLKGFFQDYLKNDILEIVDLCQKMSFSFWKIRFLRNESHWNQAYFESYQLNLLVFVLKSQVKAFHQKYLDSNKLQIRIHLKDQLEVLTQLILQAEKAEVEEHCYDNDIHYQLNLAEDWEVVPDDLHNGHVNDIPLYFMDFFGDLGFYYAFDHLYHQESFFLQFYSHYEKYDDQVQRGTLGRD